MQEFNIETSNIHFLPEAVEAFESTAARVIAFEPTTSPEVEKFTNAVALVDSAIGIVENAKDHGECSIKDFDQFQTLAEQAEEILDSFGVIEEHSYIRDILEPDLIELISETELDALAAEDIDEEEEHPLVHEDEFED